MPEGSDDPTPSDEPVTEDPCKGSQPPPPPEEPASSDSSGGSCDCCNNPDPPPTPPSCGDDNDIGGEDCEDNGGYAPGF